MKHAARRRVDGVGDVSRERHALAAGMGIRLGHGGDERLGLGVLGCIEQRRLGRALDHLPEVHHENSMAHVPHDPQVV